MLSTLVYALAAIPFALAAAPASTLTTATASATSSVTTISVGDGGLIFKPDNVKADIGAKVKFQFFPKNHSVVQADFNKPCIPKNNGIFSGFIPSVQGIALTTFEIIVEDTKPIWLYCSAQVGGGSHCQQGMVAVINPPASGPNTLEAFREAARKTNNTVSPPRELGGKGGTVLNPSTSPNGTAPTPTASGATPSHSHDASGTETAPTNKPTNAASSLDVSGGFIAGLMGMAFFFL